MYHSKLLVKNLYKTFQTKDHTLKVLDNINLSLQKGEFVSVIGPSGCGKSTLCNIIAGVDQPTSGNIVIDGVGDTNRLGQAGYMPQNPLLLPWKTVQENVMLGLTVSKVSDSIAKQKATALLKKFHLIEVANHYPATLSGGMAQRIALLRTVLFHQSFLLMDEPFGALDALTRSATQMWLLDVWQSLQSSVLFITHDIREAILLSDKIYVLSSRPAKLIATLPINLSRPRKRHHLSSAFAIKLLHRIEDLLLQQQL